MADWVGGLAAAAKSFPDAFLDGQDRAIRRETLDLQRRKMEEDQQIEQEKMDLLAAKSGFDRVRDENTRTTRLVKKPGLEAISPKDQAIIDYYRAKAGEINKKVNSPNMGKPTVAQTATDRAFGKTYEEYIARGGYADVQKNLEQLKAVRDRLTKTDSATGPYIGALPKFVRERVTPEGIDIQEQVEEVVQRNLREVLGAQFTEREGAALIKRSYNPSLPESENAKRLDRLVAQIEKAAQAKQSAVDYYEQNGTLAGYKGPRPEDMFKGEAEGLIGRDADAASGLIQQPRPSGLLGGTANAAPQSPEITPDVAAYAQKHGITPEQALAVKRARGGQ